MSVEYMTRTVDEAQVLPAVDEVQVLHAAAGDIRRGDQVVFWLPNGEGGDVAGEVTGMRHDSARSMVAMVVDHRVHFVPVGQAVIVIRGCTPAHSGNRNLGSE